MPNLGDYVTTDDGLKGEVQSVNVLRQLVKVVVTVDRGREGDPGVPCGPAEVQARKKKGKGDKGDRSGRCPSPS